MVSAAGSHRCGQRPANSHLAATRGEKYRRTRPEGRPATLKRGNRLPWRSAERDPARVVTFSDAVIAIAVTLLVLEIRPPQDTRHRLHGLAARWPSYVPYVITFMLIGQVGKPSRYV